MNAIDSTASDSSSAGHPGAAGKASWTWRLVGAALLAFTISAFVPWNLPPPPGDLDASWNVVLHWAHVHHLDFGRQVVFTFGPWGFVLLRYLPSTFGWVVAAWTVISVGFFAAIWSIARGFSSRAWAAVWMAAVITIAGGPIRQLQDVRITALSWLLLLIHFYVDERPWRAGKVTLSLGMAWAGLIKFSTVFISLPVLVVVSLDQLRRRRLPSMLMVYIAAYLGLWLMAWQPLGSLGPYLQHSWMLANGYTEGVAYNSDTEATDVMLFVVAAIMVFGTVCMVHPWKISVRKPGAARVLDAVAAVKVKEGIERGRSLLGAIGMLGVLFLLFKTGYVRHDTHEIIATSSLALMSLTFGAAVWPRVERAGRAYIVLLCCCTVGLSWKSDQTGMGISQPGLAVQTVLQIPESAATAAKWAAGGPAFENLYLNQRESPPADLLSQIDGSVDSYSGGQKMLIDGGLDYDPRPLLQSYVTYISALSKLNADFLAGPRAPRTILFDAEPIDGHYASQEEAASWPELLTRYDLKDASGDRLVLRRAGQPRSFEMKLVDGRTFEMNQWIGVPPADGPIWVKMQVRLTALGRLMRAVYKLPPLIMAVDNKGEGVQNFRLLRDIAEDGFLLSPQISDRVGFAMLYSKDWKDALGDFQVDHIAVMTGDSGTSAYFEPDFNVAFYELEFPQSDISAVPGVTGGAKLLRLAGRMTVVEAEAPVRLASDDGGKLVILAPAASRLMIPVPGGSTELDVGFGMMHSLSVHEDPTDHAVFQVYRADRVSDGRIHIVSIWKREMDPTTQPGDRGLQTAHIPLPASPMVSNVLLEVAPAGEHTFIASYWTDIRFR